MQGGKERSQMSDGIYGISAMSLYAPRLRVDLRQWCEWTGGDWAKISAVVGSGFRMCGLHEDLYTMAAGAVLRLIDRNGLDPGRIGLLALGTESSSDNAVGAVIVRGMVDRELLRRGGPGLPRDLEVPEFKHACLGGVYALNAALRYTAYDGKGRQAVVVAADIAEYERGSTGEPTQGAGSVAVLVERDPALLAIDLPNAGHASHYRGPDFRKPTSRHSVAGYASRTRRPHDFPVFSGTYSTYSYLDETAHAVEHMLAKLEVTATEYLSDAAAVFFHRPYRALPVQAMAFLQVRALAHQAGRSAELEELCGRAEVDYAALLDEAERVPDLYASVLHGSVVDPFPATRAVAAVMRRQPRFQKYVAERMSLGSAVTGQLGNLYSAALPASIAAGLEEAAELGVDLAGAPILAVGYGSGDASQAFTVSATEGWEHAARRIGCADALANPIDLTRGQYESLHDRGELPDLQIQPNREFVVTGTGSRYETGFQDLGVNYYEYEQ